jgi:hypothetical protein
VDSLLFCADGPHLIFPSFLSNFLFLLSEQDLKKQTAIRLAQEQQQSQGVPGAHPNLPVAHAAVATQPLARNHGAASYIPGAAGSYNPGASGRDPAPQHYQRLQHHSPLIHQVPGSVDASVMHPSYSNTAHYYDQSQVHKSTRKKGSRHSANSMPTAQNVSFLLHNGVFVAARLQFYTYARQIS